MTCGIPARLVSPFLFSHGHDNSQPADTANPSQAPLDLPLQATTSAFTQATQPRRRFDEQRMRYSSSTGGPTCNRRSSRLRNPKKPADRNISYPNIHRRQADHNHHDLGVKQIDFKNTFIFVPLRRRCRGGGCRGATRPRQRQGRRQSRRHGTHRIDAMKSSVSWVRPLWMLRATADVSVNDL